MTDRQQLIVNNVDTAKQLILDAERWIWAHPQTGYTEWQAHDYLAEKYEALGYTLVKAGNIPGFLYRKKATRYAGGSEKLTALHML